MKGFAVMDTVIMTYCFHNQTNYCYFPFMALMMKLYERKGAKVKMDLRDQNLK